MCLANNAEKSRVNVAKTCQKRNAETSPGKIVAKFLVGSKDKSAKPCRGKSAETRPGTNARTSRGNNAETCPGKNAGTCRSKSVAR